MATRNIGVGEADANKARGLAEVDVVRALGLTDADINKAKGLAERPDSELATFGSWTRKELQRLVKMAKAPPTIGEWRAFYARLCRLIALYRDSESEAGTFARRLEEAMDTLFSFPRGRRRGADQQFWRAHPSHWRIVMQKKSGHQERQGESLG